MRTTLDLNDDLVEALMSRHPGLSRTEAIERAVRTYLEGESVERLLSVAGSFKIEEVSADLRAADLRARNGHADGR
jgi:metal-responsive CopG/Arc/MetJ family transcriptional regulator